MGKLLQKGSRDGEKKVVGAIGAIGAIGANGGNGGNGAIGAAAWAAPAPYKLPTSVEVELRRFMYLEGMAPLLAIRRRYNNDMQANLQQK